MANTTLRELIEKVEQDDLPTNEFTIEETDKYVLLGKLNEIIAYLRDLEEVYGTKVFDYNDHIFEELRMVGQNHINIDIDPDDSTKLIFKIDNIFTDNIDEAIETLTATINNLDQNKANVGASYTKNESDNKYVNQGGTLTAPLTITGGDGSTAGKIQFDANGQITKKDTTNTIFGISGDILLLGHSSQNLVMRGTQERPTYNGNEMAFKNECEQSLIILNTANTTYFNSGTLRLFVIGKIVIFNIVNLHPITNDIPHNAIIFSGLPKADSSKGENAYIAITNLSGTNPLRYRVEDTYIKAHYTGMSSLDGVQYNGVGIYFKE